MNSTRDKKLLKKFGSHLRILRLDKGFSLRELADEADISFTQIHRIETGFSNPTYTMLISLAKALNITLIELVQVD